MIAIWTEKFATIGNIGAQKTRGGIATAFKIGSLILYLYSHSNDFFSQMQELFVWKS